MGKAMMGTGEAEGEKRASEAANSALKNPLIDEYSLKGAKGLLINITGGKDLTLFEVDEAVNQVRAEVDPEAELIIGAITDPEMKGKMRVSIVATALDNQGPQRKPVVSMIHRIHSRSSNHVERSVNNSLLNQQTLGATDGATALAINPSTVQENIIDNKEDVKSNKDLPENISVENAAYLQNINNLDENNQKSKNDSDITNFEVESIELSTPQLFSDEVINQAQEEKNDTESAKEKLAMFENEFSENSKNENEKEPEMFDSLDQDEDLEIPAFLRKQKN